MELQGSFGMFLDISDRSRMDKATVVLFGYRSEYHRLSLLYTLSETSSKWALKIGRDPRGQDPLPTTIFPRGENVCFREGTCC